MTQERKIRILIADDHYVVRNGLAGLVHTAADMEVVAEAAEMELRRPLKSANVSPTRAFWC